MPDELIGQEDVVKGYYSKLERQDQVLRFLKDEKIRSTSEVARALKMQNSTCLRKMLLELWQDKKVLAYKESGMYRWQRPMPKQLALPFASENSEG